MIYPLVQLIKENFQFLLILLVWLIAGMYGGPVVYAVIPGYCFVA
jgi:hypothetical protein